MTMHSFQDWIIFSGRSNLVLIKYNTKMMRITKVVNFTRQNITNLDPPPTGRPGLVNPIQPQFDSGDDEGDEEDFEDDDEDFQPLAQHPG